MALQSAGASSGVPPPVPPLSAADIDAAAVVTDGWQVVGSRKPQRTVLVPQTAPIEGSLITIELLGDKGRTVKSGGTSLSPSRFACLMEALPAIEEPSRTGSDSEDDDVALPSAPSTRCTCVRCMSMDEDSDEPDPVYNQYGTLYDPEVPGEIAQETPPLMVDALPSEFDHNKWAD